MDSGQTVIIEAQVSETEVMRKMEDEHLRLRRQVQTTQADRMQRAMGVHPQCRRQDRLLKTLKKEYINLLKDLKIARSGAHKKKDKKMKVELAEALMLQTETEQECDEGMALMEELEGLLRSNNKHFLELNKIATSSKCQFDKRRFQSEIQLSSTENKLETAMLRFNWVQYENKKIREEIEHMLKDRLIFNQAWHKMLGVLKKGKKFLNDLFESSTLAYDQRDEWVIKLKSLQEKGKMDQSLQIQEMRDLQKSYDHEMKLYNFLAKKGVMRINPKQEQREIIEKRQNEENIQKELKNYSEILDEINDYTKEENLSKIIESFETFEQENFSVYLLLMEYCATNIVLNKDVQRMRQNIADRRDYNEGKVAKRQRKLHMLREELEAKSLKNEELRKKKEEQEQKINMCMEKVEEIFRMLDCSLEPFQNLLGDKGPSTHHLNMTFCLITEKVKELVEIIYYGERVLQRKKEKSTCSRLKKYVVRAEPPRYFTPTPVNLYVPSDPCSVCVEARWLSRVSDILEKPFNKEMTISAISELTSDPAYERTDRIHPLTECRLPGSRVILARRYL